MNPLDNLRAYIVGAVGLTNLSEQVVLLTDALRGTAGSRNTYGMVSHNAGLNRCVIPGQQGNTGMEALGCDRTVGDLDRPLGKYGATDLSRLVIRKEAVDHRGCTANGREGTAERCLIIDQADTIQRHTAVVEHERSTATGKGTPWPIGPTADEGEVTDRDVRTIDDGQQPQRTTPLDGRTVAIDGQIGA